MNTKRLPTFTILLSMTLMLGLFTDGNAQFLGSRSSTGSENPVAITSETIDSAVSDTLCNRCISEEKAFRHSLLGTLIPTPTLVLTLPGLIFGPSLGYFHAGMPGRAWTGIGIRVVGIGGMVSSFAICGWDCGPGQDAYNIAWVAFITGAAITVGSAIYDIAAIKPAVRKKNKTLLSILGTVAPEYFTDSKAVGVRIRLNL